MTRAHRAALGLAGGIAGASCGLQLSGSASPSDGGSDATVPADASDAAVPVADASCPVGFAHCDLDPTHRCETAVDTDPNNCGRCAHACGSAHTTAAPRCVAGACVLACSNGFASCGDGTTGCETNILGGDAKSCGACRHDCLGATCTAGVCTPTTLATLENGPSYVALDAQSVYWANRGVTGGDGAIRTVMKDGSGLRDVAAFQCAPLGLAVDVGAVYWSNVAACGPFGQAIVRANKDGTGLRVLATVQTPIEVAVARGNVYFDDFGLPLGDGGYIGAVPTDGGPVSVLARGLVIPLGLHVDANAAMWGEQGLAGNGYAGTLSRLAVGAAAPTALASTVLFEDSVAIGSSVEYVTMGADGGLFSVGIDGGAARTLIGGLTGSIRIVTDGVHVYWTSYGGGRVLRAKTDGSELTILAQGQTYTYGIAVDDAYVYWAFLGTLTANVGFVSHDGAIMRVAK